MEIILEKKLLKIVKINRKESGKLIQGEHNNRKAIARKHSFL